MCWKYIALKYKAPESSTVEEWEGDKQLKYFEKRWL